MLRLCNPGKSFYYGKHLIFVGTYGGVSLMKGQMNLLRVLTAKLGTASMEYKTPLPTPTFDLEGNLLPDSMLGQVRTT